MAGLSSLTNDLKMVNSRDANGFTPLMIAARKGNVAMVDVLIRAGADVHATCKGFTVEDQLESFLRRTGSSRVAIEKTLESLGVGESLIRSFKAEADALGGTPERIQSWETILEQVRRMRGKQPSSTFCSFPEDGKKKILKEVRKDRVSMNDLKKMFSSIIASSNDVQLVLQSDTPRSFALFDYRRAGNVCGGEKLVINKNGALKLVGKDSLVIITSTKDNELDSTLLWRFFVEYKCVRSSETKSWIEIKHGNLAAYVSECGTIRVIVN